MRVVRDNWTSWMVFLAMLGASAALAPTLPETVATHFDIHGAPTGYSNPIVALISIPLITLLTLLATPWFIRVSPRGYQMENSGPALTRMLFATSVLLASVHVGTLMQKARPDFAELNTFIAFGLAVFLVILGNVLGKTERNFFIGIRTPWTITSDETWRATHRLAGKLFVAGGIAGLLSLPFGFGLTVVLILLIAVALTAILYSYFHFRRLSSKGMPS